MSFIDKIKQYDRRLVFPWMYNISTRLTGYTEREIYASPDKQVETARIMDEVFNADFLYPLDDGAVIRESIALQHMEADCDFFFHPEPFISSMEDLNRYSVPDPYSCLRMSTNIESYRRISELSDKPLAISVPGPITVACELMEISECARASIRRPELFKALLEFSTEAIVRYCKAVTEAGVKLLCISEPTAVIFSKKVFREFISPGINRIFTESKEGTFRTLHICGNTMSFLPEMLETGTECLSLDQVMDMAEVARVVPEDIVIMGNLDPIYVLAELNPEEIRTETLKLLKSMAPYPNFVISFGCDCLPDTPIENLKAALQAGKTRNCDLP